MRLERYNIIVILQDPNDEECQARLTLSSVPRENVLNTPLKLEGLLNHFEQLIPE